MFKLYKQEKLIGNPVDLLMESDSLEKLKSEARRLAMEEGCLPNDQHWVYNEDLCNYELSVNDKSKYIIRKW